MKTWLILITALCLAATLAPFIQAQEKKPLTEKSTIDSIEKMQQLGNDKASDDRQAKVYVVPVRDDIMPPILYVIRRGVKDAMEAEADCLIFDMETNGGRVDITEDIFDIFD